MSRKEPRRCQCSGDRRAIPRRSLSDRPPERPGRPSPAGPTGFTGPLSNLGFNPLGPRFHRGPNSFPAAHVGCHLHQDHLCHERQGIPMVLQRRSAFTLVELLIGVAIISTLGAILLPAIQSAREAARLTSCRSNIAQLSKGMIEHETFHGYFPSGGWSPQWLGMAERSGDSSQPGGIV